MCPGSFYELFYVPDFTKMYRIRTSRLFIRGFQRRDIVKEFYTLLFAGYTYIYLTSNSFKDHMHTGFYTLKEVFFHVLVLR